MLGPIASEPPLPLLTTTDEQDPQPMETRNSKQVPANLAGNSPAERGLNRDVLSLSCDGLIDRGRQLFKNERFSQVIEESHFPATSDIVFGVVAADRNCSNRLLCTQFLHQVPSSAVRQAQIAQENVKLDSFGQTAGRSDIRGNVDFVANAGEKFSQTLSSVGVVFDNNDTE